MDFFTIITGVKALIHCGGIYQQTDLYARGHAVYAKRGAGYVKLSVGGATSAPKVRWAEFDAGESAIITGGEGMKAPKYEGEKNISTLEAAE